MEHPFLILPWLLDFVGLGEFAHHYPQITYSAFIALLLCVTAKLAVGTVKMIPSGGQNFMEAVIGNYEDFAIDVMGEEGRPYIPLVTTLFLYILIMNWSGLVPGLYAPTSNVNTPLSMAIVVFIVTQAIGIKEHGFKYIKHFIGPMWAIAPIMLPIEIIGHFARVLSLTFRLFGNILGEDLVVAILFMLAGMFFAPLPMMFLGIFTSFVQAFIFSLLTMLYIAGAIEEAH
jgi:F-type H+-transporting ATPase subunit a